MTREFQEVRAKYIKRTNELREQQMEAAVAELGEDGEKLWEILERFKKKTEGRRR